MRSICICLMLALLLSLIACSTDSESATTTASETAAETTDPANPTDTTAPATPEKLEAPDFSAIDRDGNTVRLSDFRGKPVVLNFWASWCPPCKSEMPDFEEAYLQQGEEIHFLMVNMTDGRQETVEIAAAYVDGQGYTFPVYFDTQSEAAYAYGVQSIPATYFIDAEGHLVTYAVGALDAATLARGIDMLTETE